MTEETIKQILKFRDDRDWKQFHNPKDLAISISLEAAELLEVFQWSGTDVSNEGKQEKIKEELADVLNYCVLMPVDWISMRLCRRRLRSIMRNIP